MRKLGFVLLLPLLNTAAAEVYTFSLLPPSGFMKRVPGSTIGWGYSLQNYSTALWLVPVNLNAGVFSNSMHELLFDFPILAPSTSVAKSFDPSTSSGLFKLTWDAAAAPGFSNTGTFTLDAEWFTGDPLLGGIPVASALPATARYTAMVSTVVPEPGTMPAAVLGLGLLAASICRTRRLRPEGRR